VPKECPFHFHASKSFGAGFGISIALDVLLVIIEAVFGYMRNSTVLLLPVGLN